MIDLVKTLCTAAILVFSTATLASPFPDSKDPNQAFSHSQTNSKESQFQLKSASQQNSTQSIFESSISDLSDTSSAFINDDSVDSGDLFSDQNFNNQSLIINASE